VPGFAAVAAAGKSLERVLNAKFAEDPALEALLGRPARAVLVRTDDLDPANQSTVIQRPGLSLFLYRVDFNKTMRAAWSAVGYHDGRSHLPLDLHFLLTAWADNAEFEHAILGRALQILDSLPILSGPLLQPAGDWSAGDAIQVVLEEISTEAVMRTFDSLPVDYRLSVPYIARVVRVDGRETADRRPVTTAVTGIVPGIT
jgi:hypothetical protein